MQDFIIIFGGGFIGGYIAMFIDKKIRDYKKFTFLKKRFGGK